MLDSYVRENCVLDNYFFRRTLIYRDVFTYLKKKYKELKPLNKRLLSNIEANCFSHGKNGDINTAMAIVNLKSNHGWTDRVDNTTKGKKSTTTNVINLGQGNNPNETTS